MAAVTTLPARAGIFADNMSWPLLAIMLAAATIRVIAASLLPDQGTLLPDIGDYRLAAEQLRANGSFDNLYIMPLYPVVIVLTGAGIGQLASDIACAVVMVWLVHALALELFADRKIAGLAALWTAFYPPLIFFAVVGLTETLFITFVLASFVAWYRAAFVAASIFAVLAILVRPVFDIAGLALTFYFAAVMFRLGWRRTLTTAAIYLAIYCVMLSPWWAHNAARFGGLVRLTAGFGTSLYAGNNPLNQTGGGNLGEDYSIDQFSSEPHPLVRDRAMRDRAIAFMMENPGRVVELAGKKFIRFWRFWPRNEGYASVASVAVAILSIVPVLTLTLVYLLGWGWRERRVISPIIFFAIYLVAVHMVLIGTIRYRLPLEPFMIVFASAAVVRCARMLARNRRMPVVEG